jgi:WD40 repeat protein
MIKALKPITLLILLLGSCAPIASPTPSTVAPTYVVSPSRTPHPTQTSIPTITPYPSLRTNGPFLLFTQPANTLTIMDPDGVGRKQIKLPERGEVLDSQKAVSPNGKYIVFFTGSSSFSYDLAINIYDLVKDIQIKISGLIAPGFPQNMEPIVETVDVSEFNGDCFYDVSCKIRLLESAFMDGIYSFAWSPNSEELAFAAQIDGPSSDIYIYTLDNQNIRRLTNDPENVEQIEWSPNGKRIVFLISNPGLIYTRSSLLIADPTLNSVQSPDKIFGGTFWDPYGWQSENQYLIIASGGDGAPHNRLTIINTEKHQAKDVWRGTLEYLAIERSTGDILISTMPWADPAREPEMGLYLISKNGEARKISNNFFEVFPGLSSDQFLGSSNDQTFAIPLSGTEVLIGPSSIGNHPSISPDKQWLFLFEDDQTVTLYSQQLERENSWIFDNPIYKIIWRPDSTGVFLSSAGILYYLQLPAGQPIIAYDCSTPWPCADSSTWLP